MLNFWLDVTMLVILSVTFWVSSIVRLVFPAGTLAAGWSLWGFSFDHWLDFSFVMQCIFALAVLVHVMLHWSWVCGLLASRVLRGREQAKRTWSDGERTLLGVCVLIALLIAMGAPLAAAMFTIRSP